MSTGAISSLYSANLQSILSNAFQSASSSLSSASVTNTPQPDSGQLSPFAQDLATLQQLQQTDPTKYKQVTGQIATNLNAAAQTARQNGNTAAATQLSQLASDFNSASSTGQLPNVQDLAKAVQGGGHHHRHHAHAAGADPDGDSGSSAAASNPGSTSGSTSAATSQAVSQFLSALSGSLAGSGAQTNSSNAQGIIQNTLSSAGISLISG